MKKCITVFGIWAFLGSAYAFDRPGRDFHSSAGVETAPALVSMSGTLDCSREKGDAGADVVLNGVGREKTIVKLVDSSAGLATFVSVERNKGENSRGR